MSDSVDSRPEKIHFNQRHRPQLETGDYTLTIRPEVTHSTFTFPDPKSPAAEVVQQTFSVSGPRFSLNPQDIEAVFPSAGSLGLHSHVLPHVILKRATLPWERRAGAGTARPWLALLLFDEQDFKDAALVEQIWTPRSMKLGELASASGPQLFPLKLADGRVLKGYFPKLGTGPNARLTRESGDHDDDAVAVIDVPAAVLSAVLPSLDELDLLAHVRDGADKDDKALGVAKAVVSCNRLARAGATSIAHLVSVEGYYDDKGSDWPAEAAMIRLVSLQSWRFSCVSDQHTFQALLKKSLSGTLRLPRLAGQTAATQDAEAYFTRGCAPLPHAMRQGNTSVSWYHGPLVPGPNHLMRRPAVPNAGEQRLTLDLPARSGDQLVLYDDDIGMFDVSYACAWQIGRLLTLQNRRVALDLFRWKRSHAQAIKDVEAQLDHLPFSAPSALDFPESVSLWFTDLALVKGLPFKYLVPDPRMLPPESIRFFQVDPTWIECLRDGAFSIGRVFAADHALDRERRTHHVEDLPQSMSGFLLRSDVVSGWPGLLVDGFADRDAKTGLALKRIERLSRNVLLCLFDGVLACVDFHLKPEGLHSGVDAAGEGKWTVTPRVRVKDRWTEGKPVPVPLKSSDANAAHPRVIDVAALAKGLSAASSADFALQMIKGTEKVRFVAG